MDASGEIDDCEYIFLRSISEPEDNTLLIVVEEAKALGEPYSEELVPGKTIDGLRTIDSDATCRVFELLWQSYVAYCVRNESFTAWDAYEERSGRLFVEFTKSRFRDFIDTGTFATNDYPGPLSHWGLNCLNHIVDVIATTTPSVTRLSNPRLG